MNATTDLSRQANRAILKAAVQRRIFNDDRSLADVRRSVLVELLIPADASAPEAHAMALYSGAAFDSMPDLRATIVNLPAGSVIEIWDGRFLFGNGVSQTGYLRLSNVGGTLTETDTF